jgi:putative pyrimidine permease RutG
MFGATALAPVLMGFDPNTAILFSGLGTLLFFACTGGRLPSYFGSSFAFIAVVLAATGHPAGAGPHPNLALALGGIVVGGGGRRLGRAGGAPRRDGLGRTADAAG